ncbi:MAG: zf-TFIIB domain-containing protein [Reinekea sp.]|jgi:Zn-finger nucleic acid-binding protein
MQCPRCRTVSLAPTKIDSGLPAMGCPQCGGSFLSLLYYRVWIENFVPLNDENALTENIAEEVDTKTALTCPKCARLMTKFYVSGEVDNRIDLCSSCDEAWLDKNEWRLLQSLHLADKLPKVFTDQWQQRIRRDRLETSRIDKLLAVIGNEDTVKAVEFKNWLKDHPYKKTIIHFLNHD